MANMNIPKAARSGYNEIEEGPVEEQISYGDGSVILEYNKPGDVINFQDDRHKYFQNPATADNDRVLRFMGEQADGTRLTVTADTATRSIIMGERSPDGTAKRKLLSFDDFDGVRPGYVYGQFSGDFTIGEDTKLFGLEIGELQSISTDYKRDGSLTDEHADRKGVSPFRAARRFIGRQKYSSDPNHPYHTM
jgi:hypothetical protein